MKRIYEKDDIPNKCGLVLCVANQILSMVNDEVFFELTDGWYSIGCIGNEPFAQAVKKRKINIGTKLVTFGAELINHSEACSPLEAPCLNDPEVVEATLSNDSTCPLLRLSFNSTRRARHVGMPKLPKNSSFVTY